MEIDSQLAACGWVVQDYKHAAVAAAPGVAVREVPTEAGPADYVLFVDRQAVGVIEAKKAGTTLTGVEPQTRKYQISSPDWLPSFTADGALPFGYESTGSETRFTCGLDPVPASRRVFSFHRPETLGRWVDSHLQRQQLGTYVDYPTLRYGVQHLPQLEPDAYGSDCLPSGIPPVKASRRPMTLEAGEAYRVELNDIVAQSTGAGHTHESIEASGYTPSFAGPISVGPNFEFLNPSLEHIHPDSYHMSLSSITQVANGQTISYESQDYRPPTSSNWQVFWDGSLFKPWGEPAQLAHVFHAPAAGDYRVQVSTDVAPALYALKVSKIGDHPDVPSFRSRHQLYTHGRSNWGHSASVLGNIGVDDKDWFAVKLEAGKSYRVALAAGGRLEW